MKKTTASMKSIVLEHSTNKENQWEWLAHNYNFEGYNSIIEVGCGDGLFWKYKMPELSSSHIVSLTDIDEKRIENSKALISKMDVRAKVEFFTKDIEKPVDESHKSQYDAVLVHSVLHLCKNPTEALQRLNLLLKPGGLLGVGVSGDNAVENLFAIGSEVDIDAPDKPANDNYPESKADIDIAANFKNFTKNKYTNKLSFRQSQPVVHLYEGYLNAANVRISDKEKFLDKFKEKIQDIIDDEKEFTTEYNVVHYSINPPNMNAMPIID